MKHRPLPNAERPKQVFLSTATRFWHGSSASFAKAHPPNSVPMPAPLCSFIPQQHLGLTVFTQRLPLTCPLCDKSMHMMRDHAVQIFPSAFARLHRRNLPRSALASLIILTPVHERSSTRGLFAPPTSRSLPCKHVDPTTRCTRSVVCRPSVCDIIPVSLL